MRVCVDPGHGGLDTGIVSPSGLYEADMTLQLALLLKQKLNVLGYEVVLTRSNEHATTGNAMQDLKQRGSMANYTGCQVLVSIHGETVVNSSGGVAVQYLQGDGLSAQLAVLLHKQLMETAGLQSRGVRSTQNLSLLKKVRMPAVQLDLAVLGDDHQEALLADDSWLEIVTTACVEAIIEWQRKHWPELEMEEADGQTTATPVAGVQEQDRQVEAENENKIQSTGTEVEADGDPAAADADALPLTPSPEETQAEHHEKAIAPVVVQAEMANGSGTSKALSEEAQARLRALSQTTMERLSRPGAQPKPAIAGAGTQSAQAVAVAAYKQDGAPGITTKTSVSLPANNTLPRPSVKGIKHKSTGSGTGTAADVDKGTSAGIASGVAIPVPVTRSPGGQGGAATPFRVSAVVKTAQGPRPASVKVNIPSPAQVAPQATAPGTGAAHQATAPGTGAAHQVPPQAGS